MKGTARYELAFFVIRIGLYTSILTQYKQDKGDNTHATADQKIQSQERISNVNTLFVGRYVKYVPN